MSARGSRKVAALPNHSDGGSNSKDEGDRDHLFLTVTPQRIHLPASSKSTQLVWPESQCDASPVPPPPYAERETEQDKSALQMDATESLWSRVSKTFFGYNLSTWNCTTQSSTEDTLTTVAPEVILDVDVCFICICTIAVSRQTLLSSSGALSRLYHLIATPDTSAAFGSPE